MSVSSTNPGTYLSGTTWKAWGSGRVPVDINSSDSNFNSVERTGGSSTHTLSAGEMPNHRHLIKFRQRGIAIGTWNANMAMPNAPDSSDETMYTEYIGSSAAHNNIQPYITCFMWKRTA